MRLRPTLLLAGTALLLAPAAHSRASADDIVIYRCTDVFGQVTLQNGVPCPAGSTQERRTVEAVQSMPTFRPPAPPVPDALAPPPQADAPAVAEGEDGPVLLPPKPLYQCTAPDASRYFSDNERPEPRCLPLQMVGIGGNPAIAAGEACQYVQDPCEALPEAQWCERWRDYARETEAAWRFARPADVAAARREQARVAGIIAELDCPG